MQIFNSTLQGLMPSQDSPPFAVANPVQLPWGGPTGVGGTYVQGLALSIVGAPVQSEIFSIAISGATGQITYIFYGDRTYTATFQYNDTLATVQTALEGIFGSGNVEVTGTAGTTYTVEFIGEMSDQRIGGNMVVFAASGTPVLSRSQRGSSGAGQYDIYDNDVFTVIDAFNEYTFSTTPNGYIVTDIPSTGQPSSYPAYTRGRFFCDQIVGLTSSAFDNNNLNLVRGIAYTDVGAELQLG